MESEVSAGIVCALISANTVSGQLQTVRELIGSLNTSALIVTYLENRCKLTLDECIALFPTVEIFQVAWFWPIGMIES